MRDADKRAGMHLGKDMFLLQKIRAMKVEFIEKMNMQPEEIICSPRLVAFLERWSIENNLIPARLEDRMKGVEIEGLKLKHMTKKTPLVELYMVARRGQHVYSAHATFQPEMAGVVKNLSVHGLTFNFEPEPDEVWDDYDKQPEQ